MYQYSPKMKKKKKKKRKWSKVNKIAMDTEYKWLELRGLSESVTTFKCEAQSSKPRPSETDSNAQTDDHFWLNSCALSTFGSQATRHLLLSNTLNALLFIAELRRPEGPPSGAPYLSCERKGNPWVDFLMVIMASGIARGRVRTTTTAATESRNMAAILQKRLAET